MAIGVGIGYFIPSSGNNFELAIAVAIGVFGINRWATSGVVALLSLEELGVIRNRLG